MKLEMKDHNYSVVNSCNGFLCLANPIDNNPVIVCVPTTGQFINLPWVRASGCGRIASGLGFSLTTNQYKVVRMFANEGQDLVAEVCTLGIRSWRGICVNKWCSFMYNVFPTSLNGCLYWLSVNSLVSFDIDTECFKVFSLPQFKGDRYIDVRHRNVGIGILGGKISITKVNGNDVDVWIMKDNCVGQERWSKIFSFSEFSRYQIWPYGSLQPIMYLNDGSLLMYNGGTNAFMYKDPKKDGFKYIRVRGTKSRMEAIVHRPSFVSLNDILVGHDVRVQNVKSRCGALKLYNESKVVSLHEDDNESS